MENVCIIAPSSLRYMPYLRYYEEILAEAGIPHDVLLWDRYGTGETRPNAFVYRRAGTASGAALLPAYAGFRRFLLRHLKAHAYGAYIVLGTQVGVLLYDFLRKKPFVLDVRDHSHEGLLPYRALAFDLARRARLVCISSRGFLEWLPPGPDYVVSHNLSRADLPRKAVPFDRSRRVLSYIGAVGYYDANTKFLEGAGRQRDWDVRYIGRGLCERQLESFCRSRGISNVSFRGAFVPEEKAGFYDDANFVLGIYGDDSAVVRTLTPNRLYESCLHRRPMIVNEGTHLADLVARKGLGIAIDLRDTARWTSAVDRYYEPGHYDDYVENCRGFMAAVEADMAIFEQRVRVELGASANGARSACGPGPVSGAPSGAPDPLTRMEGP